MIRLRAIYAILLLLAGMILTAGLWQSTHAKKEDAQAESYEVMSQNTYDVILQRVYLDGEMSEERLKESGTIDDIIREYESWTFVERNGKTLIFRKEVDDISPLLKLNGYFGLDDENVLSIFDGEPANENVIHSFFQIDTAKLKSADHERLKKGIRIENVQQYKEVIEAFEAIKTKEQTAAY